MKCSLAISHVNVERVFQVPAAPSIIQKVGNQLHIDMVMAREDLIIQGRVGK